MLVLRASSRWDENGEVRATKNRRKRLYLSDNGSAINFRHHRPMECIIIATSFYGRKCVLHKYMMRN